MSDDIDIPGPDLTCDVETFYEHLSECERCGGHHSQDRFLCAIGIELLFEAGEDLPADWYPAIRYYKEREQLRREADANFEFYRNSEEP